MLHRFWTVFFLSLLLGLSWAPGETASEEWKSRRFGEKEPSVRRDFSSDSLPKHAIARLGTHSLRQNDFTDAVSYSPDGKTLASTTSAGTIHLWDAHSGEELWMHDSSNLGGMLDGQVVFTPNGKQLATASRDGVHLWDLASKRSTRLFDAFVKIAFSPDSNLAVGLIGRDLVILDLKTRSVKFRLHRNVGTMCPVAFSPNGKLVATWEGPIPVKATPSIIQLWDVSTGKLVGKLIGPQRSIRSLNFSPDGKLLVSADYDKGGCPRLWDVAGRKEITSLEHPAAFLAMFSPKGNLLATSGDSCVRLWDTSSWKEVRSIETFAKTPGIGSLAFSPDGKKLLTPGISHTLELWDVETGKAVFPVSGHRFPVAFLQFSPDGKSLASHGSDRSVRLWDLGSKTESRRLRLATEKGLPNRGCAEPGCSLAFFPDGKSLVALGGIGSQKPNAVAHVWDTTSGRNILNLHAKYHPNTISLSPDGRTLATEFGGSISLWSMTSGKYMRALSRDKQLPLFLAAFAPDGRIIASTSKNLTKGKGFGPRILLWDWTNGRIIRDFPTQRRYADSYMAFSPSGHMLASCWYAMGNPSTIDNTIRIWEPATGTLIRTLSGVGNSVACIAFSPDGRLLASADLPDRTICIWDVFTGKELAKFTGHRGRVYCVAFSPDGKTVASGSADTTILLWDVSKLQSQQPPAIPKNRLPQELAALWTEMEEKDAAKAYQAIWKMLAAGEETVAFLSGKLRPFPAPDELLHQAVADLDSDDFNKREAATTHLTKLGVLAEPAMREALRTQPSPEVRKRLERILANLPVSLSIEELRQIRGVHTLELIGSPAALRLLKKLAAGATGARLTRDAALAVQRLDNRNAKP